MGQIGENLAERFLVKQGFVVIAKNYNRKGGEIDLIVQAKDSLHFCEVKTSSFDLSKENVSPETYNPLQNISVLKLARLVSTAQLFIIEHPQFHETPWQLDGLAVYYDPSLNKARVDWIKNINI